MVLKIFDLKEMYLLEKRIKDRLLTTHKTHENVCFVRFKILMIEY